MSTASEIFAQQVANIGLEIEVLESGLWHFVYQDLHLILVNEDSEDFLNVVIPAILDFSNDNREDLMQIVNQINASIRYVKAYETTDQQLELSYEHYCTKEPDETLVLHILDVLTQSYDAICEKIQGNESEPALLTD